MTTNLSFMLRDTLAVLLALCKYRKYNTSDLRSPPVETDHDQLATEPLPCVLLCSVWCAPYLKVSV